MSPKSSMSSKAAAMGQDEQAHKQNHKYKARANKYKLKLKAAQVRLRWEPTALPGQLTGPRSAHASCIGQRC